MRTKIVTMLLAISIASSAPVVITGMEHTWQDEIEYVGKAGESAWNTVKIVDKKHGAVSKAISDKVPHTIRKGSNLKSGVIV